MTKRAANGRAQLTPTSLRVLRGIERLQLNDSPAGPLVGPAVAPLHGEGHLHTTTPRKGVTSL